MDKPNDGGPAFPRVPWDVNDYTGDGSPGMSLRDYFAGQALQGQLADFNCGKEPEYIAHWSYRYADAMLAEREKERA
jgi:hypothetical protein